MNKSDKINVLLAFDTLKQARKNLEKIFYNNYNVYDKNFNIIKVKPNCIKSFENAENEFTTFINTL